MDVSTLVLLGAAGGLLRGLMDVYTKFADWQSARRIHRQLPAEQAEEAPPFRKFCDPVTDPIAAVLHSVMGAGAAVLLGTTGQISGAYAAIVVGMSAPMLLTQLGRIQSVSDAVLGGGQAADATQTDPQSLPLLSNPPCHPSRDRSLHRTRTARRWRRDQPAAPRESAGTTFACRIPTAPARVPPRWASPVPACLAPTSGQWNTGGKPGPGSQHRAAHPGVRQAAPAVEARATVHRDCRKGQILVRRGLRDRAPLQNAPLPAGAQQVSAPTPAGHNCVGTSAGRRSRAPRADQPDRANDR